MAKKSTETVYLFNCDHTLELDTVKTFLFEMNGKHNLNISTEQLYFRLNEMAEFCETTIPRLQMDFAVFVVHANESRLSINEDNAGIGYAKIYRALLQATEDKVLIIIGGDDNYKDEDEEEKFVISRWARRKVASQFNEEYLDGKKSFIFSWDKKYRAIHEEAVLHFFDPKKKGQKFEYQPKPKPVPVIKEVKNPPPAAIDATKKGEDAKETPVPDVENEVRPRFSAYSGRDRDGQKETSHQDPTSWEAKNRDVAIRDYPAGTVLLETCMRYGKISHQAQDVVQRLDRWRPSNENESDLMERHKQTPEATVRFITDGNGAIRCVVVDVTPFWRKFLVKLSPRPLFLYCMFFINGFWGIFRCIRSMWVWFCNRFWG